MRTERTMNAVALAVEREIVCSFIFKNRWARNSLDKICGQHSSQVTRTEGELRQGWRLKASLDVQKSQVTHRLRKLEKASVHSCARRPREELLSLKVSLLACVLLATSLSLSIDHAALIKQELNNQILPILTSGGVHINRPVSMCGRSGSVPTVHRGIGNCPLNFILSLSQESLIQVRGSNSSVQLSVAFVSGVSASVTVSAQGVPAGAKVLFAPASAKPSFSSTMTISTSEGTPLGQFNITILATGGGLEKSAILSLLVVPIVHDIAIVSTLVKRTATVGSVVVINATIANYGSLSEQFELQAYANTTLVDDRSVPKLAPEGVYVGRLMWNTSGFSPGTYTVLVAVPPVQGELNLLDNSREAGRVLLIQSPGSRPSPSPAASGGSQGFTYGRQLAIVAAIAESAIVLLIVLRGRTKSSTGNTSAGPRKI
ncbi:hypothetical protein E6H21_10000 [Candidatus Bathyarchaeota archaeon]|nr:MAG: hypothetical protein E6H21_10000 [Candidatus Bathyarchaeota archaeon]